ncbi:MAG: 4-(cytidine 5'-diphospho)-2-C-methyl-D-erythritol kinase [Bacteroidales bacterium]|nr:4-(cytidine 5'-diphospho)-2-C-methyl-D-erythritol kinase [Bacteroidales bacterium]
MLAFPNIKINLGLSVLRKRPDGYHDLETLFVPHFGIRDELEIVEAPEFGIEVLMPAGQTGSSSAFAPAGQASSFAPVGQASSFAPVGQASSFAPVPWDVQQDLTAKAYRMLAADFKIPPVHISLVKHAPVGAGLGGGSADGAFALRMLSEMFSLGLSDKQLADYASRLGSDCAFFIYNRPMFGEGRGEILTPYDIDLSGYGIEIVIPDGISVSTAEAYHGIVPREASRSSAFLPLREALAAGPERWRDMLVNDFEATVFAAHPQLAAIKAHLYESGAIYASMSGSGSALFALRRRR